MWSKVVLLWVAVGTCSASFLKYSAVQMGYSLNSLKGGYIGDI